MDSNGEPLLPHHLRDMSPEDYRLTKAALLEMVRIEDPMLHAETLAAIEISQISAKDQSESLYNAIRLLNESLKVLVSTIHIAQGKPQPTDTNPSSG